MTSLNKHACCRHRGPEGVTRVKVHGLLRSGTNYLSGLISRNLWATVYEADCGGWKHGPLSGEPASSTIIVRDPYAWVLSFKVWEEIHGRIAGMDLRTFLEAPVSHPRLRETWGARHPLEAWNLANRSWLAASGRADVAVVTYESLVTDLPGAVLGLARKLGLEPRDQTVVDLPGRADTWPTRQPRPPLDVERSRSGGFMDQFDRGSLDLVRTRLDREMVAGLGYELR